MPSRCARASACARAVACFSASSRGSGPHASLRRERFSFEILHDEELEAVLLADVVERADVGMVQPRDGSGLALEALSSLGLFGGFRRQDLDGHDPSHACVVRTIDLAHPSTSQEGDDLVRSQAGAGL